ncbi:LOW QUALITY PROTEIN: hypothetical protein HID58_067647, partial [Brassica napus]
ATRIYAKKRFSRHTSPSKETLIRDSSGLTPAEKRLNENEDIKLSIRQCSGAPHSLNYRATAATAVYSRFFSLGSSGQGLQRLLFFTWEAVRPRAEEKVWAKSVWFSGAVPRQAFNMWLANLNRLPTKVRLTSWGLNIQTACCFCSNQDESRDHLFLNCTYTTTLWNRIFERLDPRRTAFLTWEELLSWLRVSAASAPSTLKKIATQSLLY